MSDDDVIHEVKADNGLDIVVSGRALLILAGLLILFLALRRRT
jgi:hypothetical protein